MDWKGEFPSGQLNYFVSLHSSGKKGLFEKHPSFKTQAEEMWTRVARQFPEFDAAEYNINGASLHALVRFNPKGIRDPKRAAPLVDELLHRYLAQSQVDWGAYRRQENIRIPAKLWEGEPEIRLVKGEEELSSLRTFIVQKMLGGEELSDPEHDHYDEDEFSE